PAWPYNGFVGQYDAKTWQYKRTGGGAAAGSGAQGEAAANTARSGEVPGHTGDGGPARPKSGKEPTPATPGGPPFEALVTSLVKPPAEKDETLQNPRCVFQIVKRHFARYTPEMVERVTGCPQETFLK